MKMLGFVESGFLSRAQTTFFALDKKPDSTNPRIFLAKLDLRQKMLAEHKVFFAARNLISSLKVGMERILLSTPVFFWSDKEYSFHAHH